MQNSVELNTRQAFENNDRKRKILSWGKLGALTLLSVYFYVFMEWLFFVTKPSFMDFMQFATKLGILLLSGLALVAFSLPFLLVLFAASLAPWWSKYWKIFLWAGGIFPALFMASTALIMVDNFTYTVFKFGIVNAQGFQRGIYGLLFLFAFLAFARWVAQVLSRQIHRKRVNSALKAQAFSCMAILVLSIPFGGRLYLTEKTPSLVLPDPGFATRHPNILLIGSDGLSADHMSVYGYGQNTTPYLSDFSKQALLAENNFTNANETTGSVVSMLTGKLPMENRTLYPPDILKGANAFQHLPGILEREGYYNAEIAVDYYADANALNMQDSFAMVNGRSITSGGLYSFISRYFPEDAAYFLSTITQRLSDRVLHIFYIHSMPNPYAEVTNKPDNISDPDKVNQIISLFENIQQPLFIHVYLLGTHAGMFSSYDDAMLRFDGYVKQVTDTLQQMGKLNNTIIVVYTDNGRDNTMNIRVPLILRFPNGEYAGKIVNNTQNLDIAPTLLDYLGIQPPNWMGGVSLLRGEPPANRPIFSAAPPESKKQDSNYRLALDSKNIKPPFYQFETIGMVICQKWYAVDTSKLSWQEGSVPGSSVSCSPNNSPNDSQTKQMMLDQLKKDGFNITTLEEALEQKRGH